MSGSGDRTQQRRGSRQVLAIERRRTRRARRLRLNGGPGGVRMEHVDKGGVVREAWTRRRTQ